MIRFVSAATEICLNEGNCRALLANIAGIQFAIIVAESTPAGLEKESVTVILFEAQSGTIWWT